jgi:hypothetical protein
MLALLLVAQIAFDCVGPHAHRARVLDTPLGSLFHDVHASISLAKARNAVANRD